jgi:multiphosphoryl transfer protein
VAVRTWDVGGDKPLPFIPGVPETNPFLGVRGVRAFVDDPEILLTQLEAICRVAVDHRVDVMFPMVTTTADVERSREHLHQASRRAGLRGLPEGLGVGIMVEVPAAALRVEQLARGLDFVSIGSNDLSQYVLAAERGNPRVAAWSDALEPAVLQLIADVCAEVPAGVRVGLCGGMAADADIAPLLVGLGVQDLSTSPVAVPPVKARLRNGSVAEFTALADRALRAPDAQSVRRLLLEAAAPAHP